MEALDICLENFRSECRPSSSAQASSLDFRRWMISTAYCVHIVVVGVIEGLRRLPPNYRTAATFRDLRRKLLQHWVDSIWSCLLILTDNYILDETQASLDDYTSQQHVFWNVVSLLIFSQ